MKYALITGAYGGIGKETAIKLSNAGYTVFALDRKVENETEGIIPIQTDVTDIDSVKDAFNKVKKITDKLDAIIHFAGVYYLDSLVEMADEKFKRAFDVNVFGAFRINKTFLPLLSHGSKIIITTSELAPLDPLPFTGVYALTKSTLDKYAYSLRMEVQLLGISVVVLRPGAVKTTLLNDSTDELDKFCENTSLYKVNSKRFKKIVNGVESRHVEPEKIAKLTLKILGKKKPKQVYKLNRNPLLLLLNLLPRRMQTWAIKQVLK